MLFNKPGFCVQLLGRSSEISTFYGLSTSLPESSVVELRLSVNQSSKGEVYLGVLSKSRADPLSAGETYVSAHPDNIIQLVTTALGTLDSYPFATDRIYKFQFEITSDKLQVSINDGEKIFATTGNFSSSYFMIGYRLDNGQNIDATISDLSIQRR